MFAPVVIRSPLHGEHTYTAQDGYVVMDGTTRIARLAWIKTQAHFEKTCRRHWAAYTRKLRSMI